LRRPSLSLQVRATLFWGWLIMGGHLLSPEQNFLTLALIGLTPGVAYAYRRHPKPAEPSSPALQPALSG
jgi:hypothetical protein